MRQFDIFPQIKGECHASTLLELEDGDIMVAWFQGTCESNQDVRILWARLHDGTWSAPRQVEDGLNEPHWNPVLFRMPDQSIRLFYKVGFSIKSWRSMSSVFVPAEGAWMQPQELVSGDTSGGRGPVKNKPILLSNGDILAPASHEKQEWDAFIDRSEDGGLTWQRTDYIPRPRIPVDDPDRGNVLSLIQPTLWEAPAGHIHALMRTNCSRICQSDSTDYGKTWCQAYPLETMPNNNSGLDVAKRADGSLFLACNPIPGTWGPRYTLALFKSTDNGASWTLFRTLAHESPKTDVFRDMPEFSYPAVIPLRNGGLAVSFTNKRRTITVCIFEPVECSESVK